VRGSRSFTGSRGSRCTYRSRSRSVDDARVAANSLDRQGTCLSRALAVAARLEGGEVVIGVDARGAVMAHAWVEVEGRPLRAEDPRGGEIARLIQPK
jgi:hypothetical protein